MWTNPIWGYYPGYLRPQKRLGHEHQWNFTPKKRRKVGFQLASRAANSCDAMMPWTVIDVHTWPLGNINTSESLAKFGAVKKTDLQKPLRKTTTNWTHHHLRITRTWEAIFSSIVSCHNRMSRVVLCTTTNVTAIWGCYSSAVLTCSNIQ